MTNDASPDTLKQTFGPILHRSDNYVVRGKEKEDGMHLYIHRVVGNKELLPRGYMLGHNATHMTK